MRIFFSVYKYLRKAYKKISGGYKLEEGTKAQPEYKTCAM